MTFDVQNCRETNGIGTLDATSREKLPADWLVMNNGQGEPNVAEDGTMFALQADAHNYVASAVRASDGHHGHSSGRGDGSDNLIAWDDRNHAVSEDGTYHTLRGAGLQRSDVVADPISAHEGKTYTHEGKNNFRLHNVVAGVRRLTPLECERLMGWPDEWTRYTSNGQEISDSHRYRMCGNGIIAPMAEWLGHRLVTADGWPT